MLPLKHPLVVSLGVGSPHHLGERGPAKDALGRCAAPGAGQLGNAAGFCSHLLIIVLLLVTELCRFVVSSSNSHFTALQSLWEFKSWMQMNFINVLNYLINLISICPAYALYSKL